MSSRWIVAICLVLSLALALSLALGLATGQHVPAAWAQIDPGQATAVPTRTPVAVGGKIRGRGACYVRLPDLPEGRYGGFGAYNPDTGVLAYAGGAEKRTSQNTITHSDLFAIRLDGEAAAWTTIPYGNQVGYSKATDKGCREMGSLSLGPSKWVSVMGKDGCDNGRFDSRNQRGGDLKVLEVGSEASRTGVRWTVNSGAAQLVGELAAHNGRLARPFAAYDTERQRIVFGQGAFNPERADLTEDRIYSANKAGNQFRLSQLHPSGRVPAARYGSCGAYIRDDATGVDGVIVLGGREGGLVGNVTYNEVWWLDFAGRPDGEWRDITARFDNQADFGPRRGGACAYDADSGYFYSWMGRASSSIPGGTSYSRGTWRVNLRGLATDEPLHWEKLAGDRARGIQGRYLIPSAWDPKNKRLFVMGGRHGLEEYSDVWAIYPDVTGASCDALDPYAPFRVGAPTDTATPGGEVTPTRAATAPPTPSPTALPSRTATPAATATAVPPATATSAPPAVWRGYLPAVRQAIGGQCLAP